MLPDGFSAVEQRETDAVVGYWLAQKKNVLRGVILTRQIEESAKGRRITYRVRLTAPTVVRTFDGGEDQARPGEHVWLDERASLEQLSRHVGGRWELYLDPLGKNPTGRLDKEGRSIDRWDFEVGVRPWTEP